MHDGKPFYVHKVSGETVWHKPAPAAGMCEWGVGCRGVMVGGWGGFDVAMRLCVRIRRQNVFPRPLATRAHFWTRILEACALWTFMSPGVHPHTMRVPCITREGSFVSITSRSCAAVSWRTDCLVFWAAACVLFARLVLRDFVHSGCNRSSSQRLGSSANRGWCHLLLQQENRGSCQSCNAPVVQSCGCPSRLQPGPCHAAQHASHAVC